jgi:asparagine synthase (glutamine-hydrolysing)
VEEYSNISPDSIKSILTLRYDYTLKPLIHKLHWQDFTESITSNEINHVENLIANKIKNSISPDVKKIAVALSGGIDSTLMLALLRKTLPDVNIETISIKFAESIDETEDAKKIAEQFEATSKVVFLENYLKELPSAISIIKLPFWDLHWYHVVKESKSKAKFLVSGDGGDELFGGYTFRYKKFLSLVNENSSSSERVKAYLNCHERDWVPDQENMFGKKIPFSWDDIYSKLHAYFDNSLPLLSQVFLADFNGKLLYNWSPLNTQFHNHFEVSPVIPMLSEELISYATHLRHDLKYDKDNNVGKILLRKILQKYVTTAQTAKQGFSVDTINLWRSYGKKLCEQYLLDGRVVKDGLINKEWITLHFKKLESLQDTRYINKFLGLLALEVWYRMFVTKEMKSNETLD